MKLTELSKPELLSFILNAFSGVSYNENVECASCGQSYTKYSYICDKCEKLLKEPK